MQIKYLCIKCISLIALCINYQFIYSKKVELRDPFSLQVKSVDKKNRSIIKLIGIIHSEKNIGAILESNGKAETVFRNDVFNGFKIYDIKLDYIILVKGKLKKKIFIE